MKCKHCESENIVFKVPVVDPFWSTSVGPKYLKRKGKIVQTATTYIDFRVYDLCHSHVAYLINQEVEPLLIKQRLGHKDIRITLNTYGHLYPNEQKKLAEVLNTKK